MSATPFSPEKVKAFLSELFAEDLHAKRVLSLANATLGVIQAASLAVHAIGLGLAAAKGLNSKHTIKQVDRLLSNKAIDVSNLFDVWVPFVVGERREIVVALDWTEFDADDQSTLAINLITTHGRATPLLWRTVVKSTVAGNRNHYEDELLERLGATVPEGVKITILADRGFGDQRLYRLLTEWEMDFVIRFRECIAVTDSVGRTKPATEWVPRGGRVLHLPDAKVTSDLCPVAAVVCVKAKKMKDAWCLATSRSDLPPQDVVSLYGRRFTIEENFRDSKDIHFGMGLSATRIGSPARRDRLLLVSALAVSLLTLLGGAGESLGMERLMKANTVKRRSYSLLRQGLHYYASTPNMKPERLEPLIDKFGELVASRPAYRAVFGLI